MSTFVKRSYELLKRGYKVEPKIGLKVARGFADLGFEEFSVTNNNKIISLFTGSVSDLPENYKDHFFPLFSPDEIIDELFRRQIDIKSITTADQRSWSVELSNQKRYNGGSVQEALLEAFLDSI